MHVAHSSYAQRAYSVVMSQCGAYETKLVEPE